MTDLIVNSSTTSATHGANKRRRSDGGEPRANKIYYVIEGAGEIQIGDETRRLETGDLAHAAPGIPHGVVNPGPGRLMILVFMALAN